MSNESAFILKQWPGNKRREVKPSDLQNFSLYYRKDIPVTLSKAPWERGNDEAQNDG